MDGSCIEAGATDLLVLGGEQPVHLVENPARGVTQRGLGVSRVLFVVPPLAGHVNPTVSWGRSLAARGHEVAWAGLAGVVDDLLPGDVTYLPVGGLDLDTYEAMSAAGRGLRGPEALKYLWEGFLLPLARATAPALLRVAEDFGPDVIVVDQHAPAGAAVARALGITWVSSASTSAELFNPVATILPKMAAWLQDQLVDLQVGLGIDPQEAALSDLRVSEELVVAFTTEALTGPLPQLPQVRFVGPSITDRPDPTPFPWDWLYADVPTVLVSLGTVNALMGGRFFAAAVEALRSLPVRAVLVAPPDLVPSAEGVPNLLVLPRVPQLALLPHLAAVVCHGGHNTVCEALAHGVPLVIAPIRDDQGIVAGQVEQAGAGVRIRFARLRADDIRNAVQHVITSPIIASGIAAVRQSFGAGGGSEAAADAVEGLFASASARP